LIPVLWGGLLLARWSPTCSFSYCCLCFPYHI
jgi:hypothetical protein